MLTHKRVYDPSHHWSHYLLSFRKFQEVREHQHLEGVAVYITAGHFRFIDETGKVTEADAKAGEARWFPAFKHKVENLSDKPFDGIYIEIKKADRNNARQIG